MTILIKTLQLILCLSLLVFVHELGHFAFARLFGVRVDKFYLFFNPKFSIVRFKKINGKWQVRWFAANLPSETESRDENGEIIRNEKGKPVMVPIDTTTLPENDWRRHESTEWGIGWLPLGGYCSINGMVDETTKESELTPEIKPWEYRSKPAWQRMCIILGGVLMNVITAVVIYIGIMGHWGKEYLPVQNAVYGYDYNETALKNGFKNGDIILKINDITVTKEGEIVEKILIDNECNIAVLRQGDTVAFALPSDFPQQLLAAEEAHFFQPRFPFVIDSVLPNSLAAQAGLQANDSIVSINGTVASMYSDVTKALKSCAEQTIEIGVVRNGIARTDSITLDAEGRMGVYCRQPLHYLKTKKIEYSFLEAIPAGWHQMTSTLVNYFKQFKLVFSKEGAQNLGGFASIGNLFPAFWDWEIFWNMTAFISVILAVMNVLPIPMLDGGYALFLLYEMIFRRKPSEKFMQIALNIGMFLLFALLIYANLNDVIRFLFK